MTAKIRTKYSKRRWFNRTLQTESLERRSLLANDIFETPPEFVDFSSGHVFVRGVVETSESRDVFKVSLGENPMIAIISGNAETDHSLKLDLLDAKGNTINRLEDRSGPNHYYFDTRPSEDYFFIVTSDGLHDVEYELTINEFRFSVEGGVPDIETRPDDVNEIGPDATDLILTDGFGEMNGELEVQNDVDVFRFTVGEFDYLDIRGMRLDGREGLSVRLFFGDGRSWQYTTIENSRDLGDPRELLGSHFQRLPAGEYFIVVSGESTETVDYRISVNAYNFPRFEPDTGVITHSESNSETDATDKIVQDARTIGGSLDDASAAGLVRGDGLEVAAIAQSKNQVLDKSITAPTSKRDFHNDSNPTDVNGDGKRTPIDVLLVIDWLNERGVSNVAAATSLIAARSESAASQPRFLDVSGNGTIEPLDALLAINELNRQADLNRKALGEAATTLAVNVDWLFSKHDDDPDPLIALI